MQNKQNINILLVGVGGQGTILASKILATVALSLGYDVKVSEIHGMAQRGGSVVTQVKMGEKIYSPLIEEGDADIIIAFEKLEGLRWAHYLKPGGHIIISNQVIEPVPVILGLQAYPENIEGVIGNSIDKLVMVNALELAEEAGNSKASNVVLMGVLSKYMDIPQDIWLKALEERVPQKLIAVNQKAFKAGTAV